MGRETRAAALVATFGMGGRVGDTKVAAAAEMADQTATISWWQLTLPCYASAPNHTGSTSPPVYQGLPHPQGFKSSLPPLTMLPHHILGLLLTYPYIFSIAYGTSTASPQQLDPD